MDTNQFFRLYELLEMLTTEKDVPINIDRYALEIIGWLEQKPAIAAKVFD